MTRNSNIQHLTAPHTTTPHRFTLNHPKNYLGTPLAVHANGDTGALIAQHLTRLAGETRSGATALGLLTPDGHLTDRGNALIDTITGTYGDTGTALTALSTLKGDGTRFITAEPGFTAATQAILTAHPRIHSILHTVHRIAGRTPTALPELTVYANDHDLNTQPFHSNTDAVGVYRAETISHIKTLCYHAGLLTNPGSTTDTHTASKDYWALEPRGTIHPVVHDAITTHPDNRVENHYNSDQEQPRSTTSSDGTRGDA